MVVLKCCGGGVGVLWWCGGAVKLVCCGLSLADIHRSSRHSTHQNCHFRIAFPDANYSGARNYFANLSI